MEELLKNVCIRNKIRQRFPNCGFSKLCPTGGSRPDVQWVVPPSVLGRDTPCSTAMHY